ncbi:succinylglutamate desuccinylase/aspartoacylase family protein [Natronospira bacteriovora]|uniref:Succinylglutamate desuccinylase/aspartoacylase family protein n=1 Tax=Natronospira bacteriovora TaxID=3069753 RepID=A0ABU0W3G2_9GAMM|nr:succinylglutamate desuccinylase/aspartoacylase family protein [Natronospira sp. AB-CW4]MDQ2068555.1 succinylglutamate desuccinylase/aspartoacylase family protein [Natronospira sp. AB-CW4]
MARESIRIGGKDVAPGHRQTINVPLGHLYTHNPITMPVHVVHGRRSGPVLFVSAAVHGDELNGIEIIRRVLLRKNLQRLRGTLIAVPIVNVMGVLHMSRYLPDRRDLNRNFPGSTSGSLAARQAHIFMREIVSKANYGIDLHTAAIHRSNLPQIRADLDDPEVQELAEAFGAPVMMSSDLREGSLREQASAKGIKTLLYEAGEALRFDEVCIRAGERGVINVMRKLGMLPASRSRKPRKEPVMARSSLWVRAPASGIVRMNVALGAHVKKDQYLGRIADPFGESETAIRSPASGVIIGRSELPLAYEGEALFHVARFESAKEAAASVEAFQNTWDPDANEYGEPPIR